MTSDSLLPPQLPKMLSWRLPGSPGWGRILDFLRLVIDPAPFPASAPLLFLQVLGGGTLKAQIAEILEFRGVSPAALQM